MMAGVMCPAPRHGWLEGGPGLGPLLVLLGFLTKPLSRVLAFLTKLLGLPSVCQAGAAGR